MKLDPLGLPRPTPCRSPAIRRLLAPPPSPPPPTTDEEQAGTMDFSREEKLPVDARAATAFYRVIMTLDRPGGGDLNERLGELAALVEDLHMLKLLYTAVASLHRAGALSDEEAAARVFDGLSRSSEFCVCRGSIAMYKLVLMKAAADGYISEYDRLRFDNDAEVPRMANAPFVKDIVESMRANTDRTEGIEANVESFNTSLNKMRRGIKHKLKVEGVVGMLGATLNFILLGAAGGVFTAGMATFFEMAVDLGDVVNLKSVAADLDARFPDDKLMEKIKNGVGIGEEEVGGYADSLLTKAVNEMNVLVVVSANAASIVPVDARVATAFYRVIMTLDRPGRGDLNERLGELADLVEDLHMLKLLYTAVASLHRAGALSHKEVVVLVFNRLSRSSKLCACSDSIAMYKLVLMKAAADGYISEYDRLRFDNDAEVARMENASFVKDIRKSVRANTARIEGLEANVESINASLDKLRRGMKRKLKVEGVVGMLGATLNVISLGAAGGVFTAGMATFFEMAVDLGDVVHLKSVAADLGTRFPDEQLMEKINDGYGIGGEALGMYADSLLAKAVKEKNVLVVVSANAAMQQQLSNQAMPAEAGEETLEAAIADPTDHHQYLSAGESHKEVKKWLLNYLPRLQKEDMAKYCVGLIENGLDSNEMLSHGIEEDDLEFMKNAHKRVLLKKLAQERDG